MKDQEELLKRQHPSVAFDESDKGRGLVGPGPLPASVPGRNFAVGYPEHSPPSWETGQGRGAVGAALWGRL